MNATRSPNEHERVVEEIVREIFDALDTTDSVAEGGFGSQREAVEEDWKDLTPEDLARQLAQAAKVVAGYCVVAESIGPVMLGVLSDAQERAEEAHRRAKLAAEA